VHNKAQSLEEYSLFNMNAWRSIGMWRYSSTHFYSRHYTFQPF